MNMKYVVRRKGKKFKIIQLIGFSFAYFVVPIEQEDLTFYTTEKEALEEFIEKELGV